MKKISLISILILFIVPLIGAEDIPVTFRWDADVQTVESVPWDRLLFYERVDGGQYDYLSPIKVLPQAYVEGKSEPVEIEMVIEYPDGEITTKYFIVQAANADLKSEDSDEVSLEINLTPLSAFNFTAVYNKEEASIDFAWQREDERFTSWKIFVSQISGGPYDNVIADIPYEEGVVDKSMSMSIDGYFPVGEETTQYFTMVGFGKYGVYSPDSSEIGITIDRRGVDSVINFRIFLE